MKCVLCNGNLNQQVVEHKEFGISLGRFKALVCMTCGEVFYDCNVADKIQLKAKKLGLFGLSKNTKVAKVGNSLAIRIPKEIADFVHLKKQNEVKIVPKSLKKIEIEIN